MSNQNNVIALDEQQEKLNAQQEQLDAKKLGSDFAKTFNKKYASMQKAETALIDIVREVVATSHLALKQFKKDVNADNSTINRYIKIAECEFINENAARLPKTVSVLLRIAQQIEKCDFDTALEEGILNSDTTLKELNEYIKETAESNDDGMVESVEPDSEVVENETTSLSTEMIESEEDCSDLLKMTIDFNWLFQQEGVKDRHLKGLIEYLADYSCNDTLSTVVWEALTEVQAALSAKKSDVAFINEMRVVRKERWENINEQQEAA